MSGLTEAEGCFFATESIGLRYNIGQKHDRYLLEAIKMKWKMRSSVREVTKEFYIIETGYQHALEEIVAHFRKYPLMGEKNKKWKEFEAKYQKKYEKS